MILRTNFARQWAGLRIIYHNLTVITMFRSNTLQMIQRGEGNVIFVVVACCLVPAALMQSGKKEDNDVQDCYDDSSCLHDNVLYQNSNSDDGPPWTNAMIKRTKRLSRNT
jgi:hypothetical protein